MGCHKSRAQREIYTNTGLSQKRRSQTDNLTHHLNKLEKEQTKGKVSRRKEIIKIREEINNLEIQKTIEKISKINKIDNPLAILTKKRRERTQITKIINEKGEIKRILQKYEKP